MEYICQHFSNMALLSVHERGLLLQRPVRLKNGRFVLENGESYSRISERITFLIKKFSGEEIRDEDWWAALAMSIKIRNSITHPKGSVQLTDAQLQLSIKAVASAVDALYRHVFNKPHPPSAKAIKAAS